MGQTVSAASDGAPPPFTDGAPPPFTIPGMPPVTPEAALAPEVKTEPEIPVVTNPGSFEELFGKPRILFPGNFEGFRFSLNKPLSQCFQVGHTIHLSGGPQGSSYKFSPTLVNVSPERPQEPNSVILGEIDNNGSLTAQVIWNWLSNCKSKLVVQTQQEMYAMVQVDGEYKGTNSTSTLTFGNIDIVKESGIIVGHHLHRITNTFDVGVEALHTYGQQGGQSNTALMLAGRYTAPQWCATASINPSAMGMHLAYYHKANDNIEAGVDYDFNPRMQESKVTLGYQVSVPRANVNFKAMIDSNWRVGSVFEKQLSGLPMTLGLSLLLDHNSGAAKVGASIQMGG